MELITTVLAFLVALGILIVIHELGHYAAARACGVKVLRFSVGFGRPLLTRTVGPDRTQWVISAVPFGGYVKMLDDGDPDSAPVAATELARSFSRQSVWRRAAIVVAGPVANLALAVLLYWIINLAGTLEPPPYLGPPTPQSVAARAGLDDGDLVLDLDGRTVRSWSDLRWSLLQAGVAGRSANLGVRGIDGRVRSVRLDLASANESEIDEAWFGKLGVVRGAGQPIVRGVVEGEVAQRAGLQQGDRIVAIDGERMATATAVTRKVRASAGQGLDLDLERAGTALRLHLVPAEVTLADGSHAGRIGIDFQELQTVRYGPLEALERAAARTWDTSVFSLRMVLRMVDGRASWHNLSGPVSIADAAGQTARIGPIAYLSFLALVSISLGVLNLLPIPVLDGGHLLYYAVEMIKGSPLSPNALAAAQRVGIGVLLLLTALALYNDVSRLLS